MNETKTLTYKNYSGTVEFTDGSWHGAVMYIDDLVSYESPNEDGLQKEFEASVDVYLDTCKQVNRQPDNPFGLKERSRPACERPRPFPFKNRTPGGPEGWGKYVPPGPERDNMKMIHPLLDTPATSAEKADEMEDLEVLVNKSEIDPNFVFSSPHDWVGMLKDVKSDDVLETLPGNESDMMKALKLREMTGVGIHEAVSIIKEAGGDFDQALSKVNQSSGYKVQRKSKRIIDVQEQLDELIKSFTPEEKAQYDLACGILSDLLHEHAGVQIDELKKKGYQVVGVDLSEEGDGITALISLEAANKIADDLEKKGND
jgi:hypothetical protein